MVKKALLGQVGDTEIRLLRVFRAVVKCGGLAAAELELNIGRSTISRHLKDLEARVGLVLCRRGRGGFALTAEGARVYEDALRLLDAIDGFRSGVAELHEEFAGDLQIGIFDKTATNPQARITRAIRNFRRLAPEVTLNITIGALNDLESALIDGRLHLAIVPEHRRSESLDYHELFSETMYLYCGQGHPLFGIDHRELAWEELQDYDYAGLGFHSPNMEVTHRFRLRRQASASDQEAIATLILSGCYIGFLPDHYAEGFVRAGVLQRIAHPECMYQVRFVVIQRHSPQAGRAARAFFDLLCAAHADK